MIRSDFTMFTVLTSKNLEAAILAAGCTVGGFECDCPDPRESPDI
jgi:hypothetical protein